MTTLFADRNSKQGDAVHKRVRATQESVNVAGAPERQTPDILGIQRAVASPNLASPSDILQLQRVAGNAAVRRLIQPKLMVGAVNDKYEQEADQVAEQVVRVPGAEVSQSNQQISKSAIQHTTGASEGFPPGAEFERRLSNVSGGRPLPASVRSYMEPRFGVDFSNARVHTGSQAAQLARSIQARAFTYGSDVFFGAGQYNPGTTDGKRLLAHELTHVVQQSRATVLRRVIQRNVDTSGGTWKTNKYDPVDDGAEILLEFIPNNTVNAKKIGLIQKSKKVERGTNYDKKAREDYEYNLTAEENKKRFQSPAQKRKAQRSDGESHIDRIVSANNPIYGAPDLEQGQGIEKTPKGGINVGDKAIQEETYTNYQLGYRYKSWFGLKTNKKSAKLYDMPKLPGATSALARDNSQKSEMTFETTALALSGKQAGTYYGSVEWGFKIHDPKKGPELLPLKVVGHDQPSAKMVGVMRNWNAGEFKDGFANPQIPIP